MWQERNWKEVWICEPEDGMKILVLSLLIEMCAYSVYYKNVSSFILPIHNTFKSQLDTFSLHKLDQHKQCPYCDYHTYQKHRIEIHIDSRHPEHDKKNFSCHHCTRRFIYENSLKTHLNNLKYGPAHVARKKLKRSMNLWCGNIGS